MPNEPEPPQTLTEACAPIFLFLTTFRRNAAASGLSIEALQRGLQRELEEVRRRCDADRRLRELFERGFYPLVATADQVVLGSDWPQRAAWTMRLLEMHYFNTAHGGKKFYNLVDEVLNDSSEAGAELAELLFTCMALGFQGELLGMPRELERRRRQLFEKARLAGRQGATLTPEAYGRNAERRVSRLPAQGILRVLLIAVGALLFAFVLGKTLVRIQNRDMIKDIDKNVEALREEAPR